MPVILPCAQWKWRWEDRGSARCRMLPPHAYTDQCKRHFKIPEIRDDACEMRSVAPSTLASNNRPECCSEIDHGGGALCVSYCGDALRHLRRAYI